MIIFNSPEIGKKISNARKEKNLTQAELTDYLGVSYQAVSNWEHGQSMPDIDKLADISEILGLSIDDLLNKPGAKNLVTDLQTPDKKVSEEVLTDFAPIMKPKQLTEKMEKLTPTLEQLQALAPFIDEDVLAEHLKKRLGPNVPLKAYQAFAPFLPEDALTELIDFDQVAAGSISLASVEPLLPFLSEEKNDELIERLIDLDQVKGKQLEAIFPFVSEKALYDLIKERPLNFDLLQHAAPFLDTTQVSALFKKITVSDSQVAEELLPFVDDDAVLDYLQKNKNDAEKVEAALPFLAQGDTDAFFLEQLQHKTLLEVQALMPFVSDDALVAGLKKRIAANPANLFEEMQVTYPFLPQEAMNSLFL